MDYEKLKELIAKVIKENGREEITGPVLQMVLMAMVNSLGEAYPQTYTDEEKAQARANIDALSNYDGEITKEKLAQSIQDTLNKVGMNVKVLPDGTDLLSEDLEEGIYVVDNITMTMGNMPKDLGLNCLALLIATSGGERTIFGLDTDQYPFVSYKNSDGEWAYVKLGTVRTENIADGAVTEDKLASQSVSSKKIKDATIGASKLGENSVTTAKIKDGAVSEVKLDEDVISKINNNVKTVAQTLSDNEVRIASKNLKLRDGNGNFFADYYSYNNAISKTSQIPSYSIFGGNCYGNKFDNAASNIFGNKFESNEFSTNCIGNIFGNRCSFNIASYSFYHNIIGNNCAHNTFGTSCESNTIGNEVSNNMFGNFLTFCKVDNGVSFIELKSKATSTRPLKNIHILSGVRGTKDARLVINIPDEYLNSSRELIITTKVTNGGPSTTEDIVMYYADEVVDKQNKQDTTLATTSKEVVGAINELFNGGVKNKSIGVGKLAQAVQDTLGKVGMNVKEVKSGEDLFSLEDGIYSLNGSTYTNYPIGIPFDASAVCILVVTHSNQKVTLYGVDGSHSYPTLPLVAIGDLTNKRWTGGSFYSFFASDYEVGHKLDQKLDNTSSLTDTEVNNIWDNN